jgi:hypothetical protein
VSFTNQNNFKYRLTDGVQIAVEISNQKKKELQNENRGGGG